MNQHTVHRLRDLFTPPAVGAPAAWRRLKRDYNSIPRPDRARFLANLARYNAMLAAGA